MQRVVAVDDVPVEFQAQRLELDELNVAGVGRGAPQIPLGYGAPEPRRTGH
jgi:hypothetical protein